MKAKIKMTPQKNNPLFKVEGVVEKGEEYGRTLGFPTANIQSPDFVPNGIFAGEVIWDDEIYPAALFKDQHKKILEAYILDFNRDLYGENITIIGYQKIRGVKRFNTEEELMNAITQDIEDVRVCLKMLQS